MIVIRNNRDSSLISTSVRMVYTQRTSDEKRPGLDRHRINPREFATTGPRTPKTAANYLLHRDLRQEPIAPTLSLVFRKTEVHYLPAGGTRLAHSL